MCILLFNCFRTERTSIFMRKGNPTEKESSKTQTYDLVKDIKRKRKE